MTQVRLTIANENLYRDFSFGGPLASELFRCGAAAVKRLNKNESQLER